MYVLLQVSTSDPNYDPSFVALVNLDRGRKATAAIRRQLFKEAAAHDVAGALWEMYYWDSAAEFYQDLDIYELLGKQVSSDLTEHGMVALDKRQVAKLPKPCRTECDQAIVRAEGIAFFAYQKHTDIHLNTSEISYSMFLKEG